MAETGTETQERKETTQKNFVEWREYSERHDLRLAQDELLKIALRGGAPPDTDFTVSSEERRRDALRGLPTRKLSPVERDIWEINRDAILEIKGKKEDYTPPPGKKVDIGDWNKDQWAEHGWTREEKPGAEAVLMQAFKFRDTAAVERATHALVLAGYTASEVIKKINDNRAGINRAVESGHPPYIMNSFQEVFSDDRHKMHDSSAKIVFSEVAFDAEKSSYGDPQTMEDMAWRLAWTGAAGGPTGDWMPGNKYAMFEARVKTKEERQRDIDEKKDYSWGKYYVNENSFIHWFRDEAEVLLDIWGPNTPIQFMEQTQSRMSNMNLIRLREMVEKKEAFKSEDGKTEYLQMWLKLQLEAWTVQLLYDNDITYRQSAVSLDKWLEQYENMTFNDPLTIYGFRTNLIQQLLIGANEYSEGRANVEGGKYLSDSKLGGAFSELVLAFYNLGDFDELQRILDPDSSFFTREGWEEALRSVAGVQTLRSGGALKFGADELAAFDEAFDKDTGKVVTENKKETEERKKLFIKFINTLGYSNLPGGPLTVIVQKALSDSVKKRFGLEDSKGFDTTVAEAWFFNRFMGGLARNDIRMAKYTDKRGKDFYTPNTSVHDKPSELFNLRANREKYHSLGGGKPAGNPQTVAEFIGAAVDPMVGIVTMEEVPVLDENDKPILDEHGKPKYKMKKSLLTLFEEAHEIQVENINHIQGLKKQLRDRNLDENSVAYQAADDQIKAEEKRLSKIYMHYVADNANFHEHAHREYTQVHLKAAKAFTDRIMQSKGLDFNDFTTYDPWGGVTIKRDVLSQKLQKELLGLARDMVKKYNWMNLNEDVRVPYYDRETGEHGFRDGKLAERMFGYDLLNRKEFWVEKNGKYVKDKNGMHMIDYNKVNKDRITLMKQIFMTEIAADIYNHQLINSGDQRFNHAYYLNMLDVLKTMPGKLIFNEFGKHSTNVSESLFSKEDMKWIKARALNGNVLGIPMGSFGFNLKWVLSSIFDRKDQEGLGFGKFFATIAKAITSGY